MADNNLNPGQKHYKDTYGQYGRIRDIEDQAANSYEHDYSSPTDHSAGTNNSPIQDHNNINGAGDNFLNNAEQDMASRSPISSSRDLSLGQQERSASHQTSGFSNSQSPISGRQKARLSGFKKKAIIAGVTVFATGGLFLGLFTAVSGPLQLVQAAKLIQDFQLGVTAGQKAARALSNTKSIAKSAMSGGGLSERVQNSRLGIFGQKQANTMINRLSERGVEISSNPFGGRGGMTVDPAKAFGIDNLEDGDLDRIAKDMGIPADKLEITSVDIDAGDGTKVSKQMLSISDDLSYSDARKVITSLDDPAMTGVKSWMQTRSTLKKTGYVSWLHPIEKAKSAAYKKLTDFIEDQVNKIMNPDNALGRIKESLGETDQPKNEDGDILDGATTDTDTNYNNTKKAWTDKFKKNGRAILSKAQDAWNALDNFLSLKSVNIVQIVVGLVCIMQSIIKEAGPYKQANIVNVAEKSSSLTMGYGSQVQSGEDIDLKSAGMAVKMTMGDDIEQLDSSANPTGETKFSSWWDAYPICTTLGTANCGESQEANVPQTLGTVADGASFFHNEAIDGAINILLNVSNPIGFLVSGICWAFNWLDLLDPLGNLIGGIISSAISALNNATGLFNDLMSSAAGYFLGTPVDPATITPEQRGSVDMYGGVFISNDQARESGGKKLTDQQAIELNLENRRYLAWENSKKPVLARLFDPADYNSSVNQLARAIRINSSEQNLGTQLANVFKVFTSAPTILATASNQLLGGSAYAASTYDYGVPTYAWTMDEMDEITNSSNGNQYDLYTNTENALQVLYDEDVFEKENSCELNGNKPGCIDLSEGSSITDENANRWKYLPAHTYAKRCLSSEIEDEDSDYKINPVDNESGEGWNYVDSSDNSYCTSLEEDVSMKPIRLYVMDYYNVVSGMCYYGDSDDSEANSACNEMQVGTTGSSGGVALGSQDPNVYQQAFASYMKANGSVEGLTVCYNGCTTVPAWFVSQYTTLSYGQGNGWQVASNLASKNGLELKTTLDGDCKLPAVFSTSSPAMGSVSKCSSGAAPNGLCGHTGLVVSMDDDGTIQTLESGSSQCNTENLSWIQTRTRSEWEGNTEFVCLGDYMK